MELNLTNLNLRAFYIFSSTAEKEVMTAFTNQASSTWRDADGLTMKPVEMAIDMLSHILEPRLSFSTVR